MKPTRRCIIIILILVAVVVLELAFDIFEILTGELMLLTNEHRPKVGRLWKEEEKDRAGQTQVTTIVDSLSQIPAIYRQIRNLDELRSYLAFKSTLLLSRDDFDKLYQSFPPEESSRLLDRAMLFDLAENSAWQSVRLSLADDKISLLFIDSYGQPLLDAHTFVGDLANIDGQGQLQNDEEFSGRIVPARLFLAAYNGLDRTIQLQIINDPQLIPLWGDRLLQVGIAQVVKDGVVAVAIEIISGSHTEINRLQARELAIGYLIQAINDLSPTGTLLSLPQQEDAHE